MVSTVEMIEGESEEVEMSDEQSSDFLLLEQLAAEEKGPEGPEGGSAVGYTPAMAEMEAEMIVGMTLSTVESFHPALEYGDDVKEKLKQAVVPLCLKYEGALPPFIEKWKEELFFCFVAGSIAYGSVKAVKDFEAEKLAKENEGEADHG